MFVFHCIDVVFFFFFLSLPSHLLHLPQHTTALNTISEKRRSFLAGNGPPPTRPKSSINLNTKENIKLRERSTPRKPRPSSVATSMPSFMHVESPSPKMRSKSSDRVNRGIVNHQRINQDSVSKYSVINTKYTYLSLQQQKTINCLNYML